MFHQSAILKPGQMAYLAQESWRLYVETIDWVASKQAYWVRPLILTQRFDPDFSSQTTALVIAPKGAIAPSSPMAVVDEMEKDWYDVREAAHLIWPKGAFQHALDTDILPWLPILHSPNPLCCPPHVKQALQRFLQSL